MQRLLFGLKTKLPTKVEDLSVWHFVLNALRYSPAALLPLLFGIVGSFVFTRIFDVVEYGILGFAIAIMSPLTSLFTEWIGQPVNRFYAEYKKQGEIELYTDTVKLMLVLSVSLTIILASLIAIGFMLIEHAIPQGLIFFGSVASIIVQVVYSIGIRMLSANFQIKQFRRSVVLASILSPVLSFLMVYAFGKNIGWLIWGPVVATAVLLPYIYQGVPSTFRVNFFAVKQTFQRFLRYGAPMTLWYCASQFLYVGDRYVLQFFHSSSQIGIYTANYNLIAQAVGLINGPLWTASGPILMQQWAERSVDKARNTISQMTDIFMIIGFGLLGGIAVIGKPFTELILGPGFREGYTVLLPVLAGSIIFGVSTVGHKGLEFVERTSIMTRAAIISAVVNLVLNILFIPKYGYMAAAYATLFSYVVYAALIWKETQNFIAWEIPWREVGISAVSALIGWLTCSIVLNSTDLSALVQVILGSLIYSLAYFLVIALLRSVLPKNRRAE